MAKRNRRLRKKLHLGEFQELGFTVKFSFPEGTSRDDVNKVIDQFLDDVIAPNGLAFEGYGLLNWEGVICLREVGHCTIEHQTLIKNALEKANLENIQISDIFDIWWD